MVTHWLALRRHLLWTVGFFGVCFAIFFCASSVLFAWVVSPLVSLLSGADALVSTRITGSLLTPIQLAVDLAMWVTLPVLLLQSWYFISPGLYRQERILFRRVLLFSVLLFIAGVLFCFYLILPNLLYLMLHARPAGVLLMLDMMDAVQFILHFVELFGFCFQLPLLCVVLVYTQIVTVTTLCQMRPYAIVLAFVLGMLLTPPEVFSQVMLAVPLCALYELGIGLSRWLIPASHAR